MKPPELDRKKRVIARETILKQGEQLMSELASSRALLGKGKLILTTLKQGEQPMSELASSRALLGKG